MENVPAYYKEGSVTMDKPIKLLTDRLLIREIERDDISDFHKIVNKKGFYYYCFDGSYESSKRFVDEAIAAKEVNPRQSFMLAVLGREDTQRVIGHVTVDYMPKEPDYLDLAYFIDSDFQGKGIATEAAKAMISYATDELKAEKLVATAHPDNKSSQKILENLGFIYAGAASSSVESTNGDNQRLTYERVTASLPAHMKAAP